MIFMTDAIRIEVCAHAARLRQLVQQVDKLCGTERKHFISVDETSVGRGRRELLRCNTIR
jgi:hypothetical protein